MEIFKIELVKACPPRRIPYHYPISLLYTLREENSCIFGVIPEVGAWNRVPSPTIRRARAFNSISSRTLTQGWPTFPFRTFTVEKGRRSLRARRSSLTFLLAGEPSLRYRSYLSELVREDKTLLFIRSSQAVGKVVYYRVGWVGPSWKPLIYSPQRGA